MWYQCTDTEEATIEKVKKYQHHHKHIQELTTVADITFLNLPCRVQGKWYHRNHELLRALGHSKSRQEKTVQTLASEHSTLLQIVYVCLWVKHVLSYHFSTNRVSVNTVGIGQPQASWHQAWTARGDDNGLMRCLVSSKWDKILLILTEVDRTYT